MTIDFPPKDAPSGHQTVFDGTEAIYFQTDPDGTPGDKYGTPADFPKNYMYLYKLSVSVASNDLTVALVDLAGNAASATNPIRVKIGDVEHILAAALSVTAADATNWFNCGSDELKTLAVGFFPYLGYNATDGVVIGFSRIPYARKYSDFSATSTNEKFCKISNITTAGANDVYQNIGYFEAVLSAGAGYTWSGVANVISEPQCYTNWLTWTPTLTGFSADPSSAVYRYMIDKNVVTVQARQGANGTSNATGYTMTLPLTAMTLTNAAWISSAQYVIDNSAAKTAPGLASLASNTNILNLYSDAAATAWTASGGKRIGYFELNYRLA